MELAGRLKKYLPLSLIILAFSAPMLLAHIALRFQEQIKQSTNEYGHLITSAQKLTFDKFETLLPQHNATTKKWQIVYVAPQECGVNCIARKKSLQQLHTLLREDGARVDVLSVNSADITPTCEADQILLVDPQGNNIMYYQRTAEPSGILKDLMRLLKYSNV